MLTVVLITKTSTHSGRCSQAQRTNLLVSIYKYHSEKIQNIVVSFRIIFNKRIERLQNILNGDVHDTTIHILVVFSKLTKYLTYYVARLILTFLSAYLVQ